MQRLYRERKICALLRAVVGGEIPAYAGVTAGYAKVSYAGGHGWGGSNEERGGAIAQFFTIAGCAAVEFLHHS